MLKKHFRFFPVAFLAVLFSGQVSAALVPGTWNSVTGGAQTGYWTNYYAGTAPAYLGSSGRLWSTGGQWEVSGGTRTSYTQLGVHAEPGGYYIDYSADYAGGVFTFLFGDGNVCTSSRTSTVTWRHHIDSLYNYLYTSDMTWTGQGVVDQDPRFVAHTYMTGTLTWNDATGSGGLIDYARLQLSPVPLPGALWLLSSGLLGLLGFRRRALMREQGGLS
ncbi:hypothetical protein EG829_28370 [bacterium]|nr:hypothetical protein [bacterium]